MRVSDIRFYLWLARRNLPMLIGLVVLCTGIAVLVALNLPQTYRATAKLLLEGQQIPVELARTTIADTVLDQIAIVEQEITSRENLLALSGKYDLHLKTQGSGSAGAIVEDMRDRVKFERLPGFSGNGNVSLALFAISFDSANRELSARVVNDIAAQVLSRNARTRAARASETIQFFQAEASRLSTTLDGLEGKIATLKTTQSRSLPDSLAFRRTQQISLGERLVALDREEATLQSRQLNLAKLAELGLPLAGSAPVRPEIQTLAELNKALTSQLALYSESSPSVVALRGRIAGLRTIIDDISKNDSTNADDPNSKLEPDFVEIKHRLVAIELERTAAKVELADLSASIDETPTTERSLNALVRSRDNTQAQYNAIIAKLAEASIGERIETGAQGTRFSVIEPALPPEHRLGPGRSLIAAAGAPFGLALGLAFLLSRQLLSSRLRRSQDVVDALDIQPLAVIPVIKRRSGRRQIASLRLPAEKGAA
jgi:uncharacterized protein involved in exopolysaccharide biosynthesis